MKTYFLYKVQAYQQFEMTTGQVYDVCTISLIGETPFESEEMIKKAKKMVKKLGYRVSEIFEYFSPEGESGHGSHTS